MFNDDRIQFTPSPSIRFESPGQCIYCGKADVRLTDEHILPYSLNGNMVLSKSSCDECADVTKRFEQKVARGMYGVFRKKKGYWTRDKRARSKLDTSKIPTLYCVIVFPVPGIRTNTALTEGNPPFEVDIFSNSDELSRALAEGEVTVNTKLHWDDLSRLLAKIAHGYLVARVGLEGYHAFLPDLILGHSKFLSHYVGCASTEVTFDNSYKVELKVLQGEDAAYIVVNIRLLGGAMSPIYQVVAARIEDASLVEKIISTP